MDPETLLGRNGQDVLIVTVEHFLPLIMVSVYRAMVLAAIMSTMDSLLVVASSAVVRDFYQQIFRPDTKNKSLTKLSRIATVLLAFVALVIALVVAISVPGRTIFWFIIFGWSGIAATFCPMIILTLFWKNYSEKGAIA